MYILLIITLLLILASASFSLSEIAFFSLPSSRLRSYRTSLEPRKRQIARLLQDSKGLLVSIFLLNTIANILVQNFTSDFFTGMHNSFGIKVGVPLALILLFGELIPKYLGLIYNEQVAFYVTPFYTWFQKVSKPIRKVITSIVNVLSRVLFFFLKVEKPLSREELESLIKSQEGKGLIQQEETLLIEGWLVFTQTEVKDIMTPLSEMEGYDVELPLSKLIYFFTEKGNTEVIIYKDSFDQILGILDAKDFFLKRNDIHVSDNLKTILYKPFYVPETTSSKALLQQFETQNESLALVVDEYGAISGSISKYALLRTISKEITGQSHEEQDFVKVSHDAIIASGTLTLQELNNYFDQELISEYHSVTIAGWLIEKLGTIAQSGATYIQGPLLFRILSSDPTRIRKVYIQYHKELDKKTKQSSEAS